MNRFLVLGLMLVTGSLSASFDTAYTHWKQEQYVDAVPLLLDLRKQAYGKEMRIDYMLGTSYCRLPGKDNLGKIYLSYALNRYPYTAANRYAIQGEFDSCTATLKPEKLVFSTLTSMGGAQLPGVNSKMYYAQNSRDKVISNNMMEVKKVLSEREIADRTIPLSEPDKAKAMMRKTLGADATVYTQGNFVYGSISRHNIDDLKSIANQMNEAGSFFEKNFGVQMPNTFIAVYLVAKERQLMQLADELHHLELENDTLGYSFQNDNSMVAINNSGSAGTLKHELAHFLVRRSFGDIPPWFDEGLAALYEVSYYDGEDLVGLRNWRESILNDIWFTTNPTTRVSIKQITLMDWTEFNQMGGSAQAQAVHHALARYFVLYLQNQHYLPKVYQAFSSRKMQDRNPNIAAENDLLFSSATGKSLRELGKEFLTSFAAYSHRPTQAQVKAAQIRLSQLDHSPGDADGKVGKNTRRAINSLFKDKGLRKIYDVDIGVIDTVMGFRAE